MKANPARGDSEELLAAGHDRLRLQLCFDGAGYCGWQRQQNHITVQQRVEEAFAKVFPSAPAVHGSSRTDTGVHAVQLTAHVDVPRSELRIPLRKLVLAINAWLPDDIRLLSVSRTSGDFHARFSALGKQYRYYVWNHPAHSPLWRRQSWHVPRRLDLAVMKRAARQFEGRHDFLAFSASPGYARRNTVRHVTHCRVGRTGALVTFVIEANGFLYKMCRGIVGTLIQVGLGRFEPTAIAAMLKSRDRRLSGVTAPAQGLVLWKVFYRPGRKRSRKPSAEQRLSAAAESE